MGWGLARIWGGAWLGWGGAGLGWGELYLGGHLYYVIVCFLPEIKINLEEGVKFAQDICCGMAYLHSLEPLIPHFDLHPHHIFVSPTFVKSAVHPFSPSQIDDDMSAKLDMAHARFSFMDNQKLYRPNWMAPECESCMTHTLSPLTAQCELMWCVILQTWDTDLRTLTGEPVTCTALPSSCGR